MKGSEQFKVTIKEYLDRLAETDKFFAQEYAKEGKNIDDCVKFILSEVKKSGCCGFTDDEIFGFAVHYYAEGKVEISDIGNYQVVVNHQVELTAEEIEEAKEKARRKIIEDEMEKQRNAIAQKPKATTSDKKVMEQPSLFQDF